MLRFGTSLMKMISGSQTMKVMNQLSAAKKCIPQNCLPSRSINQSSSQSRRFSFLDWFLMSPRKFKTDDSGIISSKWNRIKTREPYKLYQLSEGPKRYTHLTREEAMLYYTQLQTIRNIELASDSLYREKIARGFSHLYTGQEACAVGMRAALRTNDNVITAHHCHGWSYLMGASPFGILAELAGRQGGCGRGKGGSVHMYAPRFFGGNGILGAQVPIGAGLALASKLKRDGGACLAVYGDGSADKGQIFESYNMATLWKLPCVFVCENNISGPCKINYYRRGGERMPGIWVDGTDVLAVRQATRFAIEYCVEHGPMMLELNTSLNAYSPEMRALLRQQRDPLTLFRRTCVENKLINSKEIREIDRVVCQKVDLAKRNAKNDPEAPISELAADVYAECPEQRIRNAVGSYLQHLHIVRLEKKKHFVRSVKTAKARDIWNKTYAAEKGNSARIHKAYKLIK